MGHVAEDRGAADRFMLERAVCAACGEMAEVLIRRKIDTVYFCAACCERARPPDPDEDLGVGD
jgi:hypothetical protein